MHLSYSAVREIDERLAIFIKDRIQKDTCHITPHFFHLPLTSRDRKPPNKKA
jgi:hypothetical protein